MRKGLFPVLLVAVSSMAYAGNVVVGTDNSGPGVDYVGIQGDLYTDSNSNLLSFDSDLGWAQRFTLNEAVVASDVSVWASYYNVPATFELEITDGLSASADVLFSGSGTYGQTPAWVDLDLSDLSLKAGTYYLVMTSVTPVPALLANGSNCPSPVPTGPNANTVTCFQTGLWGSDGTDISTEGSVGQLFLGFGGTTTAPALTAFDIAEQGNVEFQLDSSGTPEPGTFVLLMGGLLALVAKRKFAAR